MRQLAAHPWPVPFFCGAHHYPHCAAITLHLQQLGPHLNCSAPSLHSPPLPAPQVHLILRHKSPKTGQVEEKHLQSPPFVESDSKTHVYTAILRASNNSYAVLIDGEEKKAGSLFEDFEPSINPPETIPDPEDKKPEDWVDEARWVLRRCPSVQHVLGPAVQCAPVDERWVLGAAIAEGQLAEY